jgi:hypothetical protein
MFLSGHILVARYKYRLSSLEAGREILRKTGISARCWPSTYSVGRKCYRRPESAIVLGNTASGWEEDLTFCLTPQNSSLEVVVAQESPETR